MSTVYRLFGSELSPYSVKVRSYFRYKRIPHEWVILDSTNRADFEKHAKLPLIPLVITPDGRGSQDSTPIIDQLEALYPEPPIHPQDPALAFISALLEEYGDEWGNKAMFHYRWFYEPDQQSAAERIARSRMPDLSPEELEGAVRLVIERMVPRLRFVGSSTQTKDHIEDSFRRQLATLDRHLADRTYVCGARPSFADFGLFCQLHQCSTDPTPAAIMHASAPNVLEWIRRMLDPRDEGPFEEWPALKSTLMPLLAQEVGGLFLPWTTANARALDAGEKEFQVDLGGTPFAQETQKYHAKSLAALRERYARRPNKSVLDPILTEADCYRWVQPR